MNSTANTPDKKKLRRIGETCTCFGLRKAARAVTQAFDDALQSGGLRATQFSLLTAVSLMGTVTISKLAQGMVMDRTTLTRNLKPLEKNGWLSIVPGKDRRTRSLEITPRGRKVLTRAIPLWEEVQSGVVRKMGRKNWDALMGNLGHVTEQINPY